MVHEAEFDLRALGLTTPEDLGRFCAAAGYSLVDLMRFLGVPDE
jgi:hypothetical protein